jgi:hypothetical protein
VKRTVCIRLQLTPDQDAILSASCACFNAVAELGWERREKNGIALHQATYANLRKAHPDLPSHLVISARMKATEALRSAFSLQKKGKKVSAPHWDRRMVRYDARSFRIEKDKGVVGLATVAGRIKLPLRRTVRPRNGSIRPAASLQQTCCAARLVGGCTPSLTLSRLNSFRPVASSRLTSASTDQPSHPPPNSLGRENGRRLNLGISGSSANSNPKARNRPNGS